MLDYLLFEYCKVTFLTILHI